MWTSRLPVKSDGEDTHKVVHPESTYDVLELIGTSTKSWEDAAKNAVEQAAQHLRELRVAEVVDQDMLIRNARSRPTAPRSNSRSNMKVITEVPG